MTDRSPRAAAFRRVADDPELRRALLAFGAFSVAEFGTWVTVLVYAYSVGGTSMVGLVAVIQLVPAAILAPILANRLGRLPRSLAVTIAYAAQAVALAATAMAMFSDASTPLTIGLAVAANVAVSLGRPAHNSLVPELVTDPASLTAANVATTSLENAGVFAGPALAGAVMAVTAPAGALAILAAGLMAGAWATGRIPRSTAHRTHASSEIRKAPPPLLAVPGVLAGLVVGAFQQVAIGALDVLIVVLALEELRIGEAGAGYLNAAMGLGGVLGGAMAASMVGRARMTPALAVGVGVRSSAMVAVGWIPLAAPLLAGAGIGYSVVDVANRTLLQRLVPVQSLTRIFGVLEGLAMGGLAIGSAAAPLLVDAAGVTGAFPLVGAVLPIVLAIAWRPLRRAESRITVPRDALDTLLGVEMFAGLEPPTIEALARQATRRQADQTRPIVTEGELGDRMWVIVQGTVAVSRAGEVIRTLGPGDLFGEIALLGDVPRIATVTAIGPAELFEIERTGFLDAIAAAPGTRQAFEEMAARRSAETLGR